MIRRDFLGGCFLLSSLLSESEEYFRGDVDASRLDFFFLVNANKSFSWSARAKKALLVSEIEEITKDAFGKKKTYQNYQN